MPGALPAEIGIWLRKNFGPFRQYRNLLPGDNGEAITVIYTIELDGSLTIELLDTRMWIFWRDTFRPVDA